MEISSVLIIDDDPDIREIIKFYFESVFESSTVPKIYEASNGTEAVELIKANPEISLIFSDYRMPNGDGIYVLQEARKFSQSPFLLHTGDDWTALESKVAGFKHVYHALKPLKLEQFATLLNTIKNPSNRDPVLKKDL